MDNDAAGSGFRFEGDPHDPLTGRSGQVAELLMELSDTEVAELCRYWQWRWNEYDADGKGLDGWKSSNLLSSGYLEANRRGLDVDALRDSVEDALALQ